MTQVTTLSYSQDTFTPAAKRGFVLEGFCHGEFYPKHSIASIIVTSMTDDAVESSLFAILLQRLRGTTPTAETVKLYAW